MTSNLQELTPMQLDFLKELTNIGGGNAATALSQMVDHPINMEVPMVKIFPYERLFSDIIEEEEKAVAVSIRILGDAPGSFLLVLREKDALDLIPMILGKDEVGVLDDMSISALQEVCNILCSSYMNALSRMLNITLISSVPAFVQDMFGAILSTAYIEAGQIEDYLLVIENYFLVNNNRIKAHLFFIPHPGSLDRIFSTMNL